MKNFPRKPFICSRNVGGRVLWSIMDDDPYVVASEVIHVFSVAQTVLGLRMLGNVCEGQSLGYLLFISGCKRLVWLCKKQIL